MVYHLADLIHSFVLYGYVMTASYVSDGWLDGKWYGNNIIIDVINVSYT